ncbi:uncharacterized protein ELE39_000405 [Cryptosporidium sp. chipmunk genotype I]|uniref:uncharacterized protein n=1 Tax=Cryptosporidium sp. chipmunk genotype I TaxID=1280935 RepID=UPI00351A0B15|nr:secreted protein [Cryptosporidium sp. chipmunk genotype I]
MRLRFIFIFLIALFILCLFCNVRSAEAPGEGSHTDDFGKRHDENSEIDENSGMDEITARFLSLISNRFEANYSSEFLLKVVCIYLLNILRFSVIFNAEIYNSHFMLLNVVHATLYNYSNGDKKTLYISQSKANLLGDLCQKISELNTFASINYVESDYSEKIQLIYQNSKKITSILTRLIDLLKFFETLDVSDYVRNLILTLVQIAEDSLLEFNEALQLYSTTPKKVINKWIESTKKLSKSIFLESNFVDITKRMRAAMRAYNAEFSVRNAEYKKHLETGKSSLKPGELEMAKEHYDTILNPGDLTPETIFYFETLILQSASVLCIIIANVLKFDETEIQTVQDKMNEFIEKATSKIYKRATELELLEEESLKIRKKVRQVLDLESLTSNDILASSHVRTMNSEEVNLVFRDMYLKLLKTVALLHKEAENVTSCQYLTNLIKDLLKLFQFVGNVIKKVLKDFEQNKPRLEVRSIIEIKEAREKSILYFKDTLEKHVKLQKKLMKDKAKRAKELEDKNKREKEEKKQREKELEKMLIQEKNLLKEARKKQKKEHPKKTKIYREATQDEISAMEVKEETVQTVGTTPSKVKKKVVKKAEKLQKLQLMAQISERSETIRQTIRSERENNTSERNRKMNERKERQKALKEREREEREEEQRNRRRVSQHLAAESGGDKVLAVSEIKQHFSSLTNNQEEGLKNLIVTVFDIMDSNKVADEESLNLTDQESQSSASEPSLPLQPSQLELPQHPRGPQPTPSAFTRRRASERLQDAPAGPTIELFGSSPVFASSRERSQALETSNLSLALSDLSLDDAESFAEGQILAHTSSSTSTTKSKSKYSSRSKSRTRSRSRSRTGTGPRSSSRTRTGSRSRSRTRTGSRSRSRIRTGSRSRSRTRSNSSNIHGSESGSRIASETEINLENIISKMYITPTDEYSFPFNTNERSRFSDMFSNSQSLSVVDPLMTQAMLYFKVAMPDFRHIVSSSTQDEIKEALDFCGNEINRLHTEVSPKVSGSDFLSVKFVQKCFIKEFIRLLLLLKSKSNLST